MPIIDLSDLPADVQSHELVDVMLSGANAKAARVAPCLTDPTSTAWAAATSYAVGDRVMLATGQFVEVTVAGDSDATIPTAPLLIGDTVTDGDVTWKRIAPTPDQLAEAKLVLLGALKRWADAGAGALTSASIDDFAYTLDTRQRTGFNLWPSEVKALQDICSVGVENASKAFSFCPSGVTAYHAPWCNVYFGANYCSCGADIAGFPIYEMPA